MQHNATQHCNKKIAEKYPRGTSATQRSATHNSAMRRFQRNTLEEQVQCNATQHNTTQHNSARRIFPRDTLEGQVQRNATQQCNEKISEKYLGETSARQHNATQQCNKKITEKYHRGISATQYNTVQRGDFREIPIFYGSILRS